jgi:hypothetical protein
MNVGVLKDTLPETVISLLSNHLFILKRPAYILILNNYLENCLYHK